MTDFDPDSPDFYELLGVRPDATAADIAAAHRRSMKDAHPDKHPAADRDAATANAARLNRARDVLTDPALRAAYDDERTRFRNPTRLRVATTRVDMGSGRPGDELGPVEVAVMNEGCQPLDIALPDGSGSFWRAGYRYVGADDTLLVLLLSAGVPDVAPGPVTDELTISADGSHVTLQITLTVAPAPAPTPPPFASAASSASRPAAAGWPPVPPPTARPATPSTARRNWASARHAAGALLGIGLLVGAGHALFQSAHTETDDGVELATTTAAAPHDMGQPVVVPVDAIQAAGQTARPAPSVSDPGPTSVRAASKATGHVPTPRAHASHGRVASPRKPAKAPAHKVASAPITAAAPTAARTAVAAASGAAPEAPSPSVAQPESDPQPAPQPSTAEPEPEGVPADVGTGCQAGLWTQEGAPPCQDPGQASDVTDALRLGQPNLSRYCNQEEATDAALRWPNAYGWRCGNDNGKRGAVEGDQNISVDDACARQYGDGAFSHYLDYADPSSWYCWASAPAG